MTSADRGRAVTMPEWTWATSPRGKVHPIEPRDLERADGSVETLCASGSPLRDRTPQIDLGAICVSHAWLALPLTGPTSTVWARPR